MTTTTETPAAVTLRDPVSIQEIAARLGVTTNTVNSWRTRGRTFKQATAMPDPETTVSKTPLWSWRTIEKWAQATGRA